MVGLPYVTTSRKPPLNLGILDGRSQEGSTVFLFALCRL